jgi:uncharacterized Zn finger protein
MLNYTIGMDNPQETRSEYRFRDWVACPECEEREEVSTLAHKTDIVFECYECGLVSEFELSEENSFQNLDANAIVDSDKRR